MIEAIDDHHSIPHFHSLLHRISWYTINVCWPFPYDYHHKGSIQYASHVAPTTQFHSTGMHNITINGCVIRVQNSDLKSTPLMIHDHLSWLWETTCCYQNGLRNPLVNGCGSPAKFIPDWHHHLTFHWYFTHFMYMACQIHTMYPYIKKASSQRLEVINV